MAQESHSLWNSIPDEAYKRMQARAMKDRSQIEKELRLHNDAVIPVFDRVMKARGIDAEKEDPADPSAPSRQFYLLQRELFFWIFYYHRKDSAFSVAPERKWTERMTGDEYDSVITQLKGMAADTNATTEEKEEASGTVGLLQAMRQDYFWVLELVGDFYRKTGESANTK